MKEKKMSRSRKIGIEVEIPMVINDDGEPSSHEDLQFIFKNLCGGGYRTITDPITGAVVGVEGEKGTMTPDNSVSTLELSSMPTNSLGKLDAIWKTLLTDAKEAANKNTCFLSLSRQPCLGDDWATYERMVAQKGFYPVLLARGWGHRKGLTTASVQPNVDVTFGESISALNCLNALSGPFVGLFANSPIFQGRKTGLMESRQNTWVEFMSTSFVRNDARMIGQLGPTSSWSVYLKKLWDHPIVLLSSDYKKGLPLVPAKADFTMLDFLASEKSHPFNVSGETEQVEVFSSAQHLDKAFWWGFFDARLRASFKSDVNHTALARAVKADNSDKVDIIVNDGLEKLYVEVRSIGTTKNPIASVALVLGLLENFGETQDFVSQKSWEKWQSLRKETIEKGFSAVRSEIKTLLGIALGGLKNRKMGEEKYLEPLFQIEKSPAEIVLSQFDSGGIPEVIQKNQF